MDPITQTIDTYNKFAKEYKKRYINVGDGSKLEPSLIKFISLLGKPSNILDIGSGAGFDAKYLSNQGFNVTSIDLSAEFIKIAKKVAPKVTFVKMDMRDMSFDNNIFDGVWSSATLVHLPKNEISSVLLTINKILKPNGIFYVDFKQGVGEKYVTNDGKDNLSGAKRYFSYYSQNEVSELLTKSGFKILEYFVRTNRENTWMHFFCVKTGK